ncbi:hypothetical protein BMT54_10060 [Pasteurellaceae bacterium 15-036681]|nr:hypothetical protein BMT54_10060 [Pasteurellaceae bacterium 15-036681]
MPLGTQKVVQEWKDGQEVKQVEKFSDNTEKVVSTETTPFTKKIVEKGSYDVENDVELNNLKKQLTQHVKLWYNETTGDSNSTQSFRLPE